MIKHSRLLFLRAFCWRVPTCSNSIWPAQAPLRIWRFALLGHRVPLCYLAKWCQSRYQRGCHEVCQVWRLGTGHIRMSLPSNVEGQSSQITYSSPIIDIKRSHPMLYIFGPWIPMDVRLPFNILLPDALQDIHVQGAVPNALHIPRGIHRVVLWEAEAMRNVTWRRAQTSRHWPRRFLHLCWVWSMRSTSVMYTHTHRYER